MRTFAGVIVKTVNPFGSHKASLFAVDTAMSWEFIEVLSFVLFGLLGVSWPHT